MPSLFLSALLVLASFNVASILGTSVSPGSKGSQMLVSVLIGKNDASAAQCWAIKPPFTISTQAGTVGAKVQAIGNATGGTVVFFDPDHPTDAGLHNAPAPQWVVTMQGSGVVTLPTTNKTVSLPAGSLIIASDTADVSAIGHETKWATGSVIMQLPFANGVVPDHTVVDPNGPCK